MAQPMVPMNEAEYIQKLQQETLSVECSPATLTLADNAVVAFPQSARLWYLRGTFICKSFNDSNYSLEDAVHCYQKAVELDPHCADAHEELANHCKGFLEDLEGAERHYKVAAWIRRIEGR